MKISIINKLQLLLLNIKCNAILKIFKIKHFRNYFLGNTISLIGDSLFFTTILWWVYSNSKSALSMAYVTVADTIPMIFFSYILGVLVDRLNKKKLLLLINILQIIIFFILSIIIYFNKGNIETIIIFIVLNSTLAVGKYPITSSIVPQFDREHLNEINNLDQFGTQISTIIGSALAGFILAKYGLIFCIIINLISFIIAVCFFKNIKIDNIDSMKKNDNSLSFQFKEGIKYLNANKSSLKLTVIICILVFFTSSITIILPVVVNQNLHQGGETYGLINSIKLIGAISSIFVISYIKNTSRFCNISIVFIGCIFIFIGISKISILTQILFFMYGFFDTICEVLCTSILQNNIKDKYLGRIFGILGTLIMIANTIGYITIGILIDKFYLFIIASFIGIALIALACSYKIIISNNSEIQYSK